MVGGLVFFQNSSSLSPSLSESIRPEISVSFLSIIFVGIFKIFII